MGRRRRYQRILLPGEREGRRGFLKLGLVGAALLAVGGGTFLGTRRTRPVRGLAGPFQTLTAEEATVVLALADRLVPERRGFPRPLAADLPRKVDAIVAMAHPATQKEVKQLLGLFENALAGFLLDGQPRTFSTSSPPEQDRRIRAWAQSRITVRRTGYRALKKLVHAAYYSSPETYAAVGYPGPPLGPVPAAAEKPKEEPVEEAPPRGKPMGEASPEEEARPLSRPPLARPVETEPAPRSGLAPPEENAH